MKQRPIEPSKPLGMELVFYYACPYCHSQLPIVAPFHPSMVACVSCQQKFPIVPVDERSIQFIKIMMANGPAAIDPDFL